MSAQRYRYFVDIDNLEDEYFYHFVSNYDSMIIFTRHKSEEISLPAFCLNKDIKVISRYGEAQTFIFGVIEGMELLTSYLGVVVSALPSIIASQFKQPKNIIVTNRPDKFSQMTCFDFEEQDSSTEEESESE